MKANIGGIEIEGSVSEVYEFINRGVREHDKPAKTVQATTEQGINPKRRYHKKRVLKRWTPEERRLLKSEMKDYEQEMTHKGKRTIMRILCNELGRSKGSILHEYARMRARGDA